MALKEKKRLQYRGTRAFRRWALGKRWWTTGLVVLVGLVAVLTLLGVVNSSYLGATPIGTALRAGFLGGDEEANVERVVNPVVAVETPEPVSEEVATRGRATEEESDEVAREKEAAAQEAAEVARLEAEQIAAAAEEEETALLAQEEAALEAELPTEEELPEGESAPVAPDDPTMYLEIPKLVYLVLS